MRSYSSREVIKMLNTMDGNDKSKLAINTNSHLTKGRDDYTSRATSYRYLENRRKPVLHFLRSARSDK